MEKESNDDALKNLLDWREQSRIVAALIVFDAVHEVRLGPKSRLAKEANAIRDVMLTPFELAPERFLSFAFLHPDVQDILDRFRQCYDYLATNLIGRPSGLFMFQTNVLRIGATPAVYMTREDVPEEIDFEIGASRRRIDMINQLLTAAYRVDGATLNKLRSVQRSIVYAKVNGTKDVRIWTHFLNALCLFWPQLKDYSFALSPRVRQLSGYGQTRKCSPRKRFCELAKKAFTAILSIMSTLDSTLVLHVIGNALEIEDSDKDEIILPSIARFVKCQRRYLRPLIMYFCITNKDEDLKIFLVRLAKSYVDRGNEERAPFQRLDEALAYDIGERTWREALAAGLAMAALDSSIDAGHFLLKFADSAQIVSHSLDVLQRFF